MTNSTPLLVKTKEKSSDLLLFLATRSFASALFFLALGLILAGLVFYREAWTIKEVTSQPERQILDFKVKEYQAVLSQYQQEKERAEAFDIKAIPNPFELR